MTKSHSTIDWSVARQRIERSQSALETALSPKGESRRKILEQRARALAARRSKQTENPDRRSFLTFEVANMTFAFNLGHVVEVGRLPPCTVVAGAPATLLGVFSHRGEVHCAIDLRSILGLPRPLVADARTVGAYRHFIHARFDERHLYFEVDRVNQVLSLTDVAAVTGASLDGADSDCVEGVFPSGVILLRLVALFKFIATAHTVGTDPMPKDEHALRHPPQPE